MHSHYSFDFVLKQRVKRLSTLLYKAKEKEDKSTAWDMWLVRYQNMTKEDFISFDDFYRKLTVPQVVNEDHESVQETYLRFKKKVRGLTDGIGVRRNAEKED